MNIGSSYLGSKPRFVCPWWVLLKFWGKRKKFRRLKKKTHFDSDFPLYITMYVHGVFGFVWSVLILGALCMFRGDSLTTTEGSFDLKNNFCNFCDQSDKWHWFTLASQPHGEGGVALTSTTCKHWWWWPICELRILLNDRHFLLIWPVFRQFFFNFAESPNSIISYDTYILLHNSTIDLYRRKEECGVPLGSLLSCLKFPPQVLLNLGENSVGWMQISF